MSAIERPTDRHSTGAAATPAPERTRALDTAQALERHLGNPHDPANAFSFASTLEYDRREAFPTGACRTIEDWGIERHYVPAAHGGALHHYDDILHLMRVIARRDLTVAIGHGKTYLGAVCVWMGGAREQADSLAERILDGAIVSLALTERHHGSDLLAGEVVGRSCDRGWALTGEKWLINNATRGDALCVLTRTGRDGGPRGFTLLLVDKRRLGADSFRHLPKVPTHGIRGADISGIAFSDAVVPQDAVVGEEGHGLEILLRSLQVTRTMCASLSLGAADTALRAAATFALQRRLYGRQLIDMPTVRRSLADIYADVLIAEIVSTVAARSLDVLPAEASVSSAIAKYLVPTTVDGLVARAGHLLGARAFLEDFHSHGLFQKIERDQRIVGMFDGNTLVNLQSVINQGPSLARSYARRQAALGAPGALDTLFDMSVERPRLDPGCLRMVRGTGAPHSRRWTRSSTASRRLRAATSGSPRRRRSAETSS